jgi:hypothetical protein
MGQCRAELDDGKRCRRNAKRLDGLCGTCHGITVEYKRCKQPVKKGRMRCGRAHKTREEITAHRAAQSHRSSQRPVRSAAASSQAPYEVRDSQRTNRIGQSSHRPPFGTKGKSELSLTAKRQAAKLCAEAILGQGVLTSFEDQITDFVSEKLIDELSKNWDGRQCGQLAKIARGLLAIRGYFHKLLQILGNWVISKLGYGELTRVFACQLVTAVPVVWYAKLVAGARILQISGICVCLMNDRSLGECECLHDLVLFEGKEIIGRLMTAAVHDWREIAERVPDPQLSQ